ncbi:MAG TPA: hypothetical protein VGT78_01650 [Rhizomicrobium sp.]|nr:hypothetical protein [Rhizomicrobium sp.]
MKHPVRIVLLLGAALVAGAGIAAAQMEAPPQPDMFGHGPMGERGHMGERFLADFDANHDGKVTKDEFNKGVAAKYAAMAGNSGGITEAQFSDAHLKEFRQHTDNLFHRADWNGDGKLSLEEFSTAPRAKFMLMDRDGTGSISCAPHQAMGDAPGMRFGHRGGMGGWRGAGERCQEADLNKDGKVTRAEVEKAIAQKFAEAAKGGNAVTPDGFYNLEVARFRELNGKRFGKLDADHNGKLSQAEFTAPAQKIFARLDRNNDGVITADELQSHRGNRGDGRGKPGQH